MKRDPFLDGIMKKKVPAVRKRKPKRLFQLKLVIEPIESLHHTDPHHAEFAGYDLDNSKPWPLGTYKNEAEAIAARNAMVKVQ